MLFVLTVLFAVALVAPLLFRKVGRSAFYVLAAFPAAAFISSPGGRLSVAQSRTRVLSSEMYRMVSVEIFVIRHLCAISAKG